MRRSRRLIIVLLALIAAAPLLAQSKRAPHRSAPAPAARAATASKAAPTRPKPERPVPFRAGEQLTYDISWSSYVTAGTATVTVQAKKPSYNSVAYYIVAEAQPTPLLSKLYNLHYKVDTLLDTYTLLPQRSSIYSEEGKRHRYQETLFNQAARKASFEMRTSTIFKRDVAVAPYSQDILSAIYVLRAIPLKPGTTITMPVCDGGETYRVELSVPRAETVSTPLGQLSALRIEPSVRDSRGQLSGEKLVMWMSEDARRVPVKLQGQLKVGTFVLTLRSQRG